MNIAIVDDEQVELCSIIGNIMENAILACGDVDEDERFIDLAADWGLNPSHPPPQSTAVWRGSIMKGMNSSRM